MKRREKELMGRLQAHIAANRTKWEAFVKAMVRDAWDLIDGESWLECLLLVDHLDLRLETIAAVSDLHDKPPTAKRGPRTVRK